MTMLPTDPQVGMSLDDLMGNGPLQAVGSDNNLSSGMRGVMNAISEGGQRVVELLQDAAEKFADTLGLRGTFNNVANTVRDFGQEFANLVRRNVGTAPEQTQRPAPIPGLR